MNISTIIVHYFKHVALFNLIFETKRSTYDLFNLIALVYDKYFQQPIYVNSNTPSPDLTVY